MDNEVIEIGGVKYERVPLPSSLPSGVNLCDGCDLYVKDMCLDEGDELNCISTEQHRNGYIAKITESVTTETPEEKECLDKIEQYEYKG